MAMSKGGVSVCSFTSASTINEWNELLEFKWLPSMFTYGVISL